MPVAKLRTSNTLDALRPMANNSFDTYIRPGLGNEPLLSFSRSGENPVQWIQLLQALEQQDLPGWPFLSPVKVQLQKCDKCSREFCSPINYRRHMRMHRRSLCIDKESHKNRDLLGAFWDKLSLEKAKEIVSFDDVTLEEVPGSSIIRSLTSFVRKPGYSAFPQIYVKAGSALLDVIQTRPSRLISSRELFGILDDASEGTFLCAGTAESMQRYVFDGEAGKIGLETKNLVACTSFLIEQKLVKAWIADMDAEALRCQKLLVEEEEAAQKRQAKLMERKRQKKLRQKEQKAKELANGESAELEAASTCTSDSPTSFETTNPLVSRESCSSFIEAPIDNTLSIPQSVEASLNRSDIDIEAQTEFSSQPSDLGPYPNIGYQRAHENDWRQMSDSRWHAPKTQRTRNGFHAVEDPQVSRCEPAEKRGALRDTRPTQGVNGNRVWTRKPKLKHDNNGNVNSRVNKAESNQSYQAAQNCEVMIGSISVSLGSCNSQQQSEARMSKNIGQEKRVKTDLRVGQSKVKLWRPVSRNGKRGRSGGGQSTDDILRDSNERTLLIENCQRPFNSDCDANESLNDSHVLVEGTIQHEEFSIQEAKTLLSQRWKEAIAGDHVTLVLTPVSDMPGCEDAENDHHVVKIPLGPNKCTSLGNAENLLDDMAVLDPSANGVVKARFKSNRRKGSKSKYIPKLKTVT